MSEVTRILSRIESGDPAAADLLLPLVYDELRQLATARLAQEKPGQTLQATALVHEAYLRLVESNSAVPWSSRAHFFGAAAEAMRRILVDAARRRRAAKRGGGAVRETSPLDQFEARADSPYLLEVHELLDVLQQTNAQAAEVVKLRFFGGLTVDETASALGISTRSVDRLWAYAKAWLFARLDGASREP